MLKIYTNKQIIKGHNILKDNLTKTSNKNAIEYNANINQKLNAICQPWLEQLNLTDITYIKFIDNNKRFYISTNHSWVTRYIEHKLYDSNEHNKIWKDVIFQKKFSLRYALWNSFRETDVLKAANQHNMYNGFYIFNGYEIFSFSNNTLNTNNTLIYLNHLDHFEKFICFFKHKMQDVINNANNVVIITTSLLDIEVTHRLNYPAINIPLFTKTNTMKFFLGEHSPGKYVTFAEFKCIAQLAKGKAMKEIAEHLNLSVRTVETYINNAKNKLGCFSKKQLLVHIQNSDLRFILKFADEL